MPSTSIFPAPAGHRRVGIGVLRRVRGKWRIVLGALAVLCVLLVALISRGTFETYTPARGVRSMPAGAPSWTTPCWRRQARPDRKRLSFCALVTGRVAYVTTNHLSPLLEEIHFVLLAHYHVVAAKETTPSQYALRPSIGDSVTVIGPLERNRIGMGEVEVFAVHVGHLWWNDYQRQ